MDFSLFIVPTPIGNLDDMTFRAIQVLKDADLILAEDTRTSGKLLRHFDIATALRPYHMHNEHKLVEGLVEEMKAGRQIALISDAGTPAISDPGFLLVRAAHEAGLKVSCLPGATAFVPALVNSGLPAHSFSFEGFLPAKKGRQTRLQQLTEESRTMIFYESPHRLARTLKDFGDYFGFDRPASFSREISKKFEDTQRGSLEELLHYAQEQQPKGEFVICVGGKIDRKVKRS